MQFSEEQLKNEQFFKEIQGKARDFMTFDLIHEAYHLALDLEQSLEKNPDFKDRFFDFYKKYSEIINQLKWVSLFILIPDKAVEMFKNHFVCLFAIPNFDYDRIYGKIKARLLAFIFHEERDKFKQQLRNSLFNNEEPLTSHKLIIKNEERSPTVGHWVLDYNSSLGTGIIDNLKWNQYFISSKNTKNLSGEELDKVKLVLRLYEKLKQSSLTIEGVEEEIYFDDDDFRGILKQGVFEPFNLEEENERLRKMGLKIEELEKKSEEKPRNEKRIADILSLKKMAGQYSAGSLEHRAIEEEIEKLEKETGNK